MTDEELGREIEGARARTWFIRPDATHAAMGARARELLAPEPLPEDVEALAKWLKELWNNHRHATDGEFLHYLATALLRRIGKLPLEVPAETKKPEPAEVALPVRWVDGDGVLTMRVGVVECGRIYEVAGGWRAICWVGMPMRRKMYPTADAAKAALLAAVKGEPAP